ncbi:MAG: hypothetical protein ACI8RZ_006892 [Myxococcota bacterium]|jgi:hypothetical protein
MQYDNLDIRSHEARMNITWGGQNGDLNEPVPYNASEIQLKRWAVEAIEHGSVPGIRRRGRVSLRDFVVDRFPSNATTPYNRIFLRPKTPFGT